MGKYIGNTEEKYPKKLIECRENIENNIIGCLMNDMLLVEDNDINRDDFITVQGQFYFSIIKSLKNKGFNELDDMSILSNFNREVTNRYRQLGGWENVERLSKIINENNFETNLDIFYRENILLKMFSDGFNLFSEIQINNRKVVLLDYLRSMSAESVIDWYENKLSEYGHGYSSNKVLEDVDIDFSDEFFEKCQQGDENGVPFDVCGIDVNGREMDGFPNLSRRCNGFLHGTFSMVGGHSSSGKSTFFITIIMALIHRGEKVMIISNEEDSVRFTSKFLVWILAKQLHYYKLTKKKLISGEITKEDREYLTKAQEYWREHCKGNVKFISITDADIGIVRRKIREHVLKEGYTTVFYDTFKMQIKDMQGERTDLSLVKDSRELHKLAKKYNLIMLASVQLAENTKNQLFLTANNTSNSKQLKEILDNYILIRNVFRDELDPQSRFYCSPFIVKKENGMWVEEEYHCDSDKVWRIVFIEKTRNGVNSPDTGEAFMIGFAGDYSMFKEICRCRPKYGTISK